MAQKAVRGTFITFEGPECCGKSTQAKLLAAYLRGRGRKVVMLREPGGTMISERIRNMLLDVKNEGLDSRTELFLYMASRAQTVQDVILPALRKGSIVICDRFLDSTVVYQGYGLGIDRGLIARMGTFATQGVRPALTILLDAPLKKSLDRIGSRKDRIERRSFAYHSRVKNGYMQLARKEPQRIKVVKVAETKEVTQQRIRELVLDVI